MDIDYNEFLRIMSCILIVLLIIQGLDYIVGIGVNNYLFIIFCIVFAFTMGTIYHNILEERNRKDIISRVDSINKRLDMIQEKINLEYELEGLSENVLLSQIELNKLRNELNIPDNNEVVNDGGFVQ